MQDEYIFTELEYSKLIGISKEGVRSRRRAGKLEGEYIIKNNLVLYKRIRPNNGKQPQLNRATRPSNRRRGVMVSGEAYKYGRKQPLQKANDYKALNRIKNTLNSEELGEVNDELVKLAKDKVRQKKQQRLQKSLEPQKNYGGFYSTSSRTLTFETGWNPLEPVKKNEYDQYLEDNDLKEDDDGPNYYW